MACVVNPDGTISCPETMADMTATERAHVAAFAKRASSSWNDLANENIQARVNSMAQKLNSEPGKWVVLFVEGTTQA
jgi:hypothetical protein